MPSLKVVIVLIGLGACGGAREPVRLAGDGSDTIIINSRYPRALRVHAFDADGNIFGRARIRFEWMDGIRLPVTEAGVITCSNSGDLHVRAALRELTTRVLVRCRLVEHVRIEGPLLFILGDSALSQPRPLRFGAYGADRQPVVFTSSISLEDTRVATLHGTTLGPRSPGSTRVSVEVGDRDAGTGVSVYQRVEGLDALDTLSRVHPMQRVFAVPLRLRSGQRSRQALQPGYWRFILLPPRDHATTPIRIQVEGGSCRRNPSPDIEWVGRVISERVACETGPRASLEVYRTDGPREPAEAAGYLIVDAPANRLIGSRFIPRVVASEQSIRCVSQFLSERGYEVRTPSRTEDLVNAARRETRLGTPARTEHLEVQLVADSPGVLLGGRAWAVDSFPLIGAASGGLSRVVMEPTETTVADARQAFRTCGHPSRAA